MTKELLGDIDWPPVPADAGERLAAAAAADDLLDVAWCRDETPLGPVVIAASPRGLLRIAYDLDGVDPILQDLADRVSPRVVEAPARLDHVRAALDEYFDGRRDAFGDIPIDWSLVARPFGRDVLAACAGIPFGGVSSYGEVAAAIGKPGGARAVGNALGANPVPIVVPCHRVLAAGRKLGGYTGGVDKKVFLLRLEGVLAA